MTTEVQPATLDPAIRDSAYSSGDFHRIYFGKVLTVRADKALAAG